MAGCEGCTRATGVVERLKSWIAEQQARTNISSEYNLALGRIASEIKKLEN